MSKTGILLVNLGTPTSYKTKSVRRYLVEFLLDKRVIDIPWLWRFLLVRGVIAFFRSPTSAKAYKQLWTSKGSPLRYHTEGVTTQLQAALGKDYVVRFAMRYGQPSIREVVKSLRQTALNRLIVVPLYPQYASATTGSVHEELMEAIKGWQVLPELHLVSQFYRDEPFVQAWVQTAAPFLGNGIAYDRYVFSYHGLPVRQIKKGAFNNHCQLGACCNRIVPNNAHCYRAQCMETTRLLIKAMGLPPEKCLSTFQSRLGRAEWLQPYMTNTLRELSSEKHTKLLVFSPSFVMDCLETNIEIGVEYAEEWEKHGGERLDVVPCLNESPAFIHALQRLVGRYVSEPTEQ